MSRRHANRRAARVAAGIRSELLHAAGCVFRGGDFSSPCASILATSVRVPEEDETADGLFLRIGAKPRRVSVPRSLRPKLGRWIGGAQ